VPWATIVATLPNLMLGHALAAAPGADQTFFESIDVNVVNVDVVVMDRAGLRITDLKREDFQLLEDGKPVEITNFYVAAEPGPGEGAAGALDRQPSPSELKATDPPAEQQNYIAILVDNLSLTPDLRHRLLPALRQLLAEHLRPGDRLLLASYDGGSVKLRQAPTTDAKAISAALEQVAQTVAAAPQEIERRRVLSDISAAASASHSSSAGPSARRDLNAEDLLEEAEQGIQKEVQTEVQKTKRTVQALGQFVSALGGLPGRKLLVYAGGGLSIHPGETLVTALREGLREHPADLRSGATTLEAYDGETSALFRELTARANASRVTFYPLGATARLGVSSAEMSGIEAMSSDLQTVEESNRTAPLEMLASGTGGLFSFNAADPSLFFRQMRADLESFYSLGYTPNRTSDGKTHRLDVRVGRAGLKVRFRDAYRDRTAEERTVSHTQAALLFGVTANPLQVALEIESEAREKDGNIRATVVVRFPISKITLLPHEYVHEGEVAVFIGSRDAEGRASTVNHMTVPVRVANEKLLTASSQLAAVRVALLLRPGRQTIAITVRDQFAHLDSTVTADYEVGAHLKEVPAK